MCFPKLKLIDLQLKETMEYCILSILNELCLNDDVITDNKLYVWNKFLWNVWYHCIIDLDDKIKKNNNGLNLYSKTIHISYAIYYIVIAKGRLLQLFFCVNWYSVYCMPPHFGSNIFSFMLLFSQGINQGFEFIKYESTFTPGLL